MGRFAARTGARRRSVVRWLLLALAAQAVLAVIDATASKEVIFTTTYVLAPFALAMAGNSRATAAVGVTAIALAIASGYWNDYALSTDHVLRITIVVTGSILATLAAWALERAADERARMQVLAAVSHLSGAEHVEEAIEGLAQALVPAVADLCWVDLEEPDGELRRLFEHPGDAPPPRSASQPQLIANQARALVPLRDG